MIIPNLISLYIYIYSHNHKYIKIMSTTEEHEKILEELNTTNEKLLRSAINFI